MSQSHDAHVIGLEMFDRDIVESITPASGAVCCGALGCQESDDLAQVKIKSEAQRVLCKAHKEIFIDKHRGDE